VAKVDLLFGRQQTHLFYNLDAAVGINCPNRKDDVVLVQYLLKNATKVFPDVFTWDLLNYPIAGIWEKNWQSLLRVYLETERLRRQNMMVSNDRVDPVVGGHVRGPVHHLQYVIVALNLNYSILRPADYPRIAEVGDCPGELRLPLKWKVLDNRH
jgi:hypothetical protein